ncbi:beta-galactosidase [Methylocystis bryophila]|uniref:Beta-galactosidase n=1 Tax=Methylocystis bryophila TaxID=655015 RepID=A0A1W6N1L8_9HYPH|nr:beta-galactosidase [Methylocystis bryophila]ARN83715.1 beta-galactosidase [Methylocystis bryophila]BDV38514.1 beta-galactosidase [Methylocystis bryophila]
MTKQRLGVCYYPEHWPEDLWTEDARRMRDVGLSVVRIGEFAWSRLEPEDGRYDFDWLARAIDVLHEAGLRVVLGTPTATPPKWLVDKMPDMLARNAQGRPRGFGSRRHYCFSYEPYARECERIVTALAQAFGAHPAVVAWQIDNEYGCHDTVESYSPAAREAFRRWCEHKYGDIGALNRAWGNVFWSMELSRFDQIELPHLTVTEANPACLLDFKRFSSDQVAAFHRRQVEIIRRHSPSRDILHNFMGAFTAFDHFAVGRDLDVAAWDSYPLGFLERSHRDEAFKRRFMRVGDPDFQAFHHDLYRACGAGRLWIMEQQPGAVNWAPWNPLPAKGAVRLWSFEAFAAGAEVVSYFRWRQAPFAQEQMHEGLLLPNSEPNEAYHVARAVARELESIDAKVETECADVALVFDYDSAFAWEIEPQGQDFSYFDLILDFYGGLRKLGLNVDVVPPTPEAMARRKLIVAPALFASSAALTRAFSESGALVLLGPRSGSKTEDFQIPPGLPPGDFRPLVDVAIQRVESLRPGAQIPVEAAENGAFVRWREIIAAGAEAAVLLRCDDGAPALTRRERFLYLAGLPNDLLRDALLRRLANEAGLTLIDLPEHIRLRDNGPMRYVFNYGERDFDLSPILGEASLLLGERRLPPCGVALFRRPG